MNNQTRVEWTESEKQALAQTTANIILKRPGTTLLAALEQAQTSTPGFPYERRRDIKQTRLVPWLYDAVRDEIEQRTEPQEPEIVERIERQGVADLTTDAMFREIARRALSDNPALGQLGERILDEIRRDRAEVDRVESAARGDYMAQAERVSRERNLLRVLIVGAMPMQREFFQKRLPKNVVAETWKRDRDQGGGDRLATLQSAARRADAVFIMNRWCGHTDADIAASAARIVYRIPTASGLTTTARSIQNWIETRTQKGDAK
jgi:hypothetical protein